MPEPVNKITPYQRLKEAIRSGDLRPGQQLVESALAEWCEVSRTPIREALSKLQHDGLVERNERGLVVRERGPEEVLDIYETRITLEGTAARLAAERRSAHDLMLLRRALARLDRVTEGDVDAMVNGNRQFHVAVWRASRNVSLTDLLERLDLHLARYPATTLSSPGRWARSNEQHRAMVDAIEARDSATAEKVAIEHFTDARDIRLSLFDD
ncbi:GntR family transcriptional regulator [Actinophytocola gossypii]|uniref:GntR family transcriptional regulator n=1 Tax=Actinophytocola gossypii TaxID=2812003 RepID=A0ABT2J6U3_9PSEU|nr:GntR family transcriptional regulator [Actinophytocola gossypii]MCT2583406.1 GntR family transcriptional regulator [Actinophytocola gossypii]